MGKTIELPLGLDISDVSNIGQYSLTSGREYDATDIKMSEVRNVLGASSYSLKTLCLSTQINEWAAFKPTRLTHPSGMTISSSEFVYQKPNDTSGYKLGDFAGYNHQAPTPDVIEGDSAIEYVADGTTATTTIIITLPEWDVRDFAVDGLYVISRKQGGGFSYTNTVNFTDFNIENKSVGIDITYEKLANDYTLELETWYKSASVNEFVKHNDFTSTITMDAIPEPVAGFYAEIPYTMEYGSSSYNYSTGNWVLNNYGIYDAFNEVYISGSFDIYAKKEGETTWTYQKTVTINAGETNSDSGTLTFDKPIMDNVEIEWREV